VPVGETVQEVLGLGDAGVGEAAFPVVDHRRGGPGGVDVDDGFQIADEDGAFGGVVAGVGWGRGRVSREERRARRSGGRAESRQSVWARRVFR